MGRRAKAGIIVLIILLILSLAGAGVGFYSFQEERTKAIALSEELDDLKIKKRIVEAKLAESKKIIDDLNEQLDVVQIRVKQLNDELQQERSDGNNLRSRINNLQSQLQEQEKIKKELEAKQVQAQKRIVELGVDLSKYKIKEEVTLGKIIISDKKPVSEEVTSVALNSSTLEGRVLTINRDYDFAVINLGSLNGLNSGEIFSLYKQDSYIGDIQAEKVQETMSAFGFVSDGIREEVGEGDEIILNRIVTEQRQATEETSRIPQAHPKPSVEASLKPPPEASPEVSVDILSQISQTQPAPAALQGKILVVNKEYDFAVINLGGRDGVGVGDTFSVYHNDSYVGDVKVDKTREIISTCIFESKEIEDAISEGDKVIRK